MIWNISTPRFTNSGTLSANVVMSDTDNILDTRKGHISGTVNMGGGNDTFLGGKRTDKADGGDGNDTLSGFKGSDRLFGGMGDDRLDGGDENDYLVGGEGADYLSGKSGNDKLIGGLGVDFLFGGIGKDTFVFNAVPLAENMDRIRDFSSKDDTFQLNHAVLTAIGAPGKLAASAFRLGAAAADADDRIIYNKATGALYYDPDGNGAEAQVQIAQLANKAKLVLKDFIVI